MSQTTDVSVHDRILSDRARYVSAGVSTPGWSSPTPTARASVDVDGRSFIDFAGGIGCQNTGHRFGPVVEAVREQLDEYLHQCFMVGVYEPYVEVCRRLAELSPCAGEEQKSILAQLRRRGGRERRQDRALATGRPAVVVFDNAFHGRTSRPAVEPGTDHASPDRLAGPSRRRGVPGRRDHHRTAESGRPPRIGQAARDYVVEFTMDQTAAPTAASMSPLPAATISTDPRGALRVRGIAGCVRWEGLRQEESGVGASANTLHIAGLTTPACMRTHGPAWDTRVCPSSTWRAGISLCATKMRPSGWYSMGRFITIADCAANSNGTGHKLSSESDTEVIVHLYEDQGPAFVHSLNGMFAITVSGLAEHLLLLVRDRLGVKPFYWHDDGRRILFGSELEAILAAGDLPDALDPCVQTISRSATFLLRERSTKTCGNLSRGIWRWVISSGVYMQRYWDIPPAVSEGTDESCACDAEWCERLGECLEDSVPLRMIADVPLGAFLSGGLDSAAAWR